MIALNSEGAIEHTHWKVSWGLPKPQNRGYARPTTGAKSFFLVCLQLGDDSIETFPPIFVFDLRNAPLEIMHDAVDLP